jgi:hypothetical protein
MITRFVGLPGAGKSHLADMYAKDEKRPLIGVSNRLDKYFFSFVFLILKPLTFFHFFKQVFRETQRNTALLRWKLTVLLFPAFAREAKAVFHKNPVLDEGLLQFILSIYDREIGEGELNKYTYYLDPKKCRVLLVEASTDVRERRMRGRNRIPRQVFGQSYAEQRLSILERNYTPFKSFITRNYTNDTLIND